MNNPNPCVSVTNIDSSASVSVCEIDLIHELLKNCDPKLRQAAEATPAYVVSANNFGAHFDDSRSEFLPDWNDDDDPSETAFDTEYFGAFVTREVKDKGGSVLCEGPKIFLCLERMQACAKQSSEDYRGLLIKVFMHEWMHAAMHADIPSGSIPSLPETKYLAYAIEEAIANYGALYAIDAMNSGLWAGNPIWSPLVSAALQFAERQPPEYALGAKTFRDRGRPLDPCVWIAAKKWKGTFENVLALCHNLKQFPSDTPLKYEELREMWRILSRCL